MWAILTVQPRKLGFVSKEILAEFMLHFMPSRSHAVPKAEKGPFIESSSNLVMLFYKINNVISIFSYLPIIYKYIGQSSTW